MMDVEPTDILGLSTQKKFLVHEIVAAMEAQNITGSVYKENNALYFQAGSNMRGNLGQVLDHLLEIEPVEQLEVINQFVDEVATVVKTQSQCNQDQDPGVCVEPKYLAYLSGKQESVYAWGALGGGLYKYVSEVSSSGYKTVPSLCTDSVPGASSEVWKTAVQALSELPIVEQTQLENGIVCLRGDSPYFAARVLDCHSLLEDAGIEYNSLGVFFAIPTDTAILILPVEKGIAQKQAIQLVQYVGYLVGDPGFANSLGVLGEYSYYWNPKKTAAESIKCYEHECVVDGEDYIELVLPSHLYVKDTK